MVDWLIAGLVFFHVATGSVALVTFWLPLMVKKGQRTHRVTGRVFAISMIAAGLTAMFLASFHLTAAEWVNGTPETRLTLGWMMLYLGFLSTVLVLFGLKTVRNKGRHYLYNTTWIVGLHGALAALAIWIFWLGWSHSELLLIGVSFIAFLMVPGNIRFILRQSQPAPGRLRREWLYQHFTSMIGAGIAAYSAFLSFGAALFMPTLAFNPYLWTIPTILGVSFMLWLAKRQPRYD
ncbi:hypothetical protein CWE12_10755 [Aliidiomarina sedimenti]|uniref:DUF2306 domain-containing protein n=1 Tax=Aliidiomarina sedimenti TaxID=1933879 RepID=A0ABY0BWR8_9GAMM|nr:hypothetical protein CWE12_10755 [Aliidiomarina sedimenti]